MTVCWLFVEGYETGLDVDIDILGQGECPFLFLIDAVLWTLEKIFPQ